MKIKVAKYMSQFFVNKGVTDMFMITGGAAMHLNDAFGHQEGLKITYNHHEQACTMAAEGYIRESGKVAPVCVTGGPGGTNAITGVFGAYVDSIPMFVVTGQAKRETTVWSTKLPLRQLGDQEVQITDVVRTMTKYAKMITDPKSICEEMEKAWFLMLNGRPGPVWLDIPGDVASAMIETDELEIFDKQKYINEDWASFNQVNPIYNEKDTKYLLEKVFKAKRPVILAGTAIRHTGQQDEFIRAVDKLGIPVVTAWDAHDIIWDTHPLYCGRPGTVGTRGGNFVIQNADLLVILGCRMNIRMIGYNFGDFGKNAYKIAVDIDEAELHKPTIHIDYPIHADLCDVLRDINLLDYEKNNEHQEWVVWCRNINNKYPATLPQYYMDEKGLNPYVFTTEFFKELKDDDSVVCGNGAACVITFQTAILKKGQRLYTNSGSAAMGYGFPAAVGACVARPNKRIICVDGDGSFMMNLQELQTVVFNKLDIKIFLLNNNGYHSIRQTQRNLFQGQPYVGIGGGFGLSIPDYSKVIPAFDIPYYRIDSLKNINEKIREVLDTDGPIFCEVFVDWYQDFAPKSSSKVLSSGKIVSAAMDDMAPFLDREEYEENHIK
ncbi:acetolactate synthase isozyme 1 large subunit [Lachnospiraceae bacterium]|nr:acetolactate synthase isozyme 1 large subunit [Lachnospiraceae bacterium]